MKTIEELRKKEREIDLKVTVDRMCLRNMEDALDAVRAEIAALTAFSPPNRITHSDQLRVGMRVRIHMPKSDIRKTWTGTVDEVSCGHGFSLYKDFDVNGLESKHGGFFIDQCNIAKCGSLAIPIGPNDNWVERVEEAVKCPYGDHYPVCCPKARCPHA